MNALCIRHHIVRSILLMLSSTAVLGGVNDIKPSPILNLQASISDELIVSIRKGETPINELIVVFTEEDQKHLPVRIEQKFTPLCAAASGKNIQGMTSLIELGADVNSMCISTGYITNPLELAYMNVGMQDKPNAATTLLTKHGAQVSAGWVEWDRINKRLTELRKAQSKQNVADNRRMLGQFAGILLKSATIGAIPGGQMDSMQIARTLIISAARQTDASQTAQAATQQSDPIARAYDELTFTPFTHKHREFFDDLETGKAWCAGTKQTESVIDKLKTENAVVAKMALCECFAVPPDLGLKPFVCGIQYSMTKNTTRQ